jgi:hypothetical protein
MTIDPTTVPIGAVVQCDPTGVRTHLRNTECPEMGITRVFVPVPDGMTLADAEAALADATPDQEVPRDEWANIAVGSRVRIVEVDGDEHTVKVDYACRAADVVWLYDEDHDYDGAKIARVYLLDAPTPPDPDAELVAAIEKSVPIGSWDGREVLRRLRAEGFDVTHEAAR